MGRFDLIRKWALAGLTGACSWFSADALCAQSPMYYSQAGNYYRQMPTTGGWTTPANTYNPYAQQNPYSQGTVVMTPNGPVMVYYYYVNPTPTMVAPRSSGTVVYGNQANVPPVRMAPQAREQVVNVEPAPSRTAPSSEAPRTAPATVVSRTNEISVDNSTPSVAAPMPVAEALPLPRGAKITAAPANETPSTGAVALPAEDAALGQACTDCGRNRRSWSVSADALLWSARGDSVPYGQIVSNVGNLLAPAGAVALIDSDYSMGARLQTSLQLSPRTELCLGGTWWQNRTNSSLTAPADPSLIILPSAVFDPINSAATSALSADAHQDMHLLVGDAAFKYSLCGDDSSFLKLTLGGRYAHLDENFNVNYVTAESSAVATKINFDGAGPRLGLEGAYTVCGRTFVYARGDISLLYGHFGASFVESSAFVVTPVQVNTGDDRVVPVLETEIGVGWRGRRGHLEVMAGYSAVNWFNTMTTSSLIQGVQDSAFATNRNNLSDTLTFDGPFLRVGFRY